MRSPALPARSRGGSRWGAARPRAVESAAIATSFGSAKLRSDIFDIYRGRTQSTETNPATPRHLQETGNTDRLVSINAGAVPLRPVPLHIPPSVFERTILFT